MATIGLILTTQSVSITADTVGSSIGISGVADKIRRAGSLEDSSPHSRKNARELAIERQMKSTKGSGSGTSGSDTSSEDMGISLGISAAGKGEKKSSKKSDKSGKSAKKGSSSSKGNGKGSSKGKGNSEENYAYDDDYFGETGSGDDDDDDDNNNSAPNAAPVGSAPSGSGGGFGTPTAGPPTPGGGGGGGGGSIPTAGQPTSPIDSPPSGRETPTLNPQGPAPTPPPTQPRCQIAGDGLFGSQVGLSEELVFYYQVQVAPSVTASEVNLNALNSVETAIGEQVLPRFFDQCVGGTAPVAQTARSSSMQQANFQQGAKTRQKNSSGNRHLRALQSTELGGFSTRPRDTVVDGGKIRLAILHVKHF